MYIAVHKHTYIGLRRAELELDECDPGLFHPHRPTSGLDDGLVEDQTVNQLAVFYRTANLLDNSDVLEVDIVRRLDVDGLGNRVDGHVAKEAGVLRHNLGRQGSVCGLQQGGSIGERDGLRHVVENLDSSCGSALERFRDDGRVNALAQESLGSTKESATDDDD